MRFALLLVFLNVPIACLGQDNDPFRVDRENLARIRSIEFEASQIETGDGHRKVPDGGGVLNSFVAEKKYKFFASGAYFRVDDSDGSVAFDGRHYQSLNPKASIFAETESQNSTPPASFPSPVDMTFSWIFSGQEMPVFSLLQDADRWAERKEASERVDAATVEVSVKANFERDLLYVVRFGSDQHVSGWTSYVMPGRKLSSKLEVVKSTLIDTDVGQVWIPIQTHFEGTKYEFDTKIIEETLRVNHGIDADLFVLSTLGVSSVINDDVRKSVVSATPVEAGTSPANSLALLNIVCLAVGLAVLAAWRITRKKKTT
jgi:hypothetical protein